MSNKVNNELFLLIWESLSSGTGELSTKIENLIESINNSEFVLLNKSSLEDSIRRSIELNSTRYGELTQSPTTIAEMVVESILEGN